MTTARARYGLPFRPFLYTLDQVADLLVVPPATMETMVHYDGRSIGIAPKDKVLARNISPAGTTPEWRVEELELMRWFRHTGFTAISRSERRR